MLEVTSATSSVFAFDKSTLHGATQNSLPCITSHSVRTAALPLTSAGCLPWGVLLTYFNGEHTLYLHL